MEGDAIIISEVNILKQSPDTDCVEYPQKVDGRTIRNAHTYVFTRKMIGRCFLICGIDLFNVRQSITCPVPADFTMSF